MKYLLVCPYGWFDSYMYRDLIVNEKVSTYYLNKPAKNKIMNFFRRVHCSFRINQIIDLPGKGLWDYKLLEEVDNNTCVIFSTGALSLTSRSLLKKIKKKSGRMVLLIVDSMHASSWHIKIAKPRIFNFAWDLILSFDQNDCKEFGFQYLGKNYYSILADVAPSEINSDIYYVGREKRNCNRNQKVIEFQKLFAKNSIICNFNLIDSLINKGKYKDVEVKGLTVSYSDIPYEKVVSDVKSSNCIFEIVQDGQAAQTIRYFEAVCYNKKLLTNNFNICNFPFYNSSFMKCFSTFDDIDLEWVRRKENIDYGYSNEFSPVKILDLINSNFEKR